MAIMEATSSDLDLVDLAVDVFSEASGVGVGVGFEENFVWEWEWFIRVKVAFPEHGVGTAEDREGGVSGVLREFGEFWRSRTFLLQFLVFWGGGILI
jgi:hypothetical protein